MVIIKAENLSKVYGKNENKVIALDNIELEVIKGEFVAIVGASGSGKSTLLHQIGGVDKPTNGKVIIDNEDIYKLDEESLAVFRRRKIGIMFQAFNLIPVLSVEENIKLPALLDNKKADEGYFMDLVKTLGLADRLNHLPSELSGGQQQRVALARALINKPAIILADEPTGNLDSETSKEIIAMLKLSIRKYNQTAIVITHDISIAENADRIIKIKDGKVVK
ncbi:ABC transporter ATP-binding protein [Clostridium saccharoperbutylacetonicum]|uniref:ABC transporter ATP-binding protein n=1 Tax=Clostridium saccharoperbutylacetonicum TaxID=36745 RepID=UPI000983E77E|nr:ABC transporter ATP-binding protein [Clostridium saccharoperbutylacetonicum]AQR96065.1 putative ABC transporter ATP-binding protein [Clostridium saccharoperbutylacetonicum]NSB31934.1 putative ABC transport system ATP-binding protein [Clostridium saccharoperbutylacetonicum]